MSRSNDEDESFGDVFFSNINLEDKVKLIDTSQNSKMRDRVRANDKANDITLNLEDIDDAVVPSNVFLQPTMLIG